eukprot:CAMPEP_0201647266 /NCGR_PEP_ID=MMETSP0493-20130528/35476_1 /ASSEMBLY_ACC=CAM_ASM_000838 /TAXON_ID=420259 /ORGANISM="Thalassiosira gravida, Strain GMp14c1" /LENGTH=40 /DNA_ID= /DNA_START= /DNA_END= /DNA_ORIENTATION=
MDDDHNDDDDDYNATYRNKASTTFPSASSYADHRTTRKNS